MSEDRERLRSTFNEAAALYDVARPRYPEALFDTLAESAGLRVGDRVLEVGCGTGIATLPLARRGYRVTCVEIGADMVQIARRNLEAFPDVRIEHGTFEAWHPQRRQSFDLVVAATAWKWVDPALRYRRAWQWLRPGGHLAFWSATHHFPEGGDPFFEEIQEVYDALGEGAPAGAQRPGGGRLPTDTAEIEASGLFRPVLVRQFVWEVDYDAERYLQLLDTFSGHIAMERRRRDMLYGEVRRRLTRRPDGMLRRGWGAVLHVAQRVEQPGI